MKTRLGIVIATIVVMSPLARAQTPETIAGDGVFNHITGGTTPFAKYGYSILLPANSGNTCQEIGMDNVGNYSGTYTYSKTGDTTCAMVMHDTTDGVSANYSMNLASAIEGGYNAEITSPPKYAGAAQSGQFIYVSFTALRSIAGMGINCTVDDGGAPFANSGNYTIAFAATGRTYEMRDAGGNKTSSGTYSYSLANRRTAAIRLADSAAGSCTVYAGFGAPLVGIYAIKAASGSGFQFGSFTLSDTAPPAVVVTSPKSGQNVTNSTITI